MSPPDRFASEYDARASAAEAECARLRHRVAELEALLADTGALRLRLRRAEEELGRREQALRQVLDALPYMVFAKDQNGRFLLANQAVADAYATTVEAMIGTPHALVDPHPPQLRAMLLDDQEVIRSRRPKLVPPRAFVDAGGRQRILQTTKVPYRLPGGQECGVFGISVDVTERHDLQHKLQRLLHLQEVQGVVAHLAHDFANLLTVVEGSAAMLFEQVGDERARHEVGEILRATESATELTRRLHALGRASGLEIVEPGGWSRPPGSEVLRGTETVLLVEDEDALRRLLQRALSRHGYHVLVAENGEAALAICDALDGAVDLLITDVVIPGPSGSEVARAVRERWPEVAVIFTSAYPRADLGQFALPADATFLPKPYPYQALMRVIREVVDRRSLDST